ncbi:hypothetical protein C0Q98_27675 [Streptomyces albidoflavus]|nr:hypothetical protein C0Q98_27675 [Streptomyces albidoflavus]
MGLLRSEFDQGELVNPFGDESAQAVLLCGRFRIEEYGLDVSGGRFTQGGLVGVACVAEDRLQDAGDLREWAQVAQFGQVQAKFLQAGCVTVAQRVGAGQGSGAAGRALDDLAS